MLIGHPSDAKLECVEESPRSVNRDMRRRKGLIQKINKRDSRGSLGGTTGISSKC